MLIRVLRYSDKDFKKMTVSSFYNEFEVSLIISHYIRGGELSFSMEDDARKRIKDKVAKFRKKGLL